MARHRRCPARPPPPPRRPSPARGARRRALRPPRSRRSPGRRRRRPEPRSRRPRPLRRLGRRRTRPPLLPLRARAHPARRAPAGLRRARPRHRPAPGPSRAPAPVPWEPARRWWPTTCGSTPDLAIARSPSPPPCGRRQLRALGLGRRPAVTQVSCNLVVPLRLWARPRSTTPWPPRPDAVGWPVLRAELVGLAPAVRGGGGGPRTSWPGSTSTLGADGREPA